MSVSLPNGAIIAIASGYGTSKAMSAVTNANPAVATLASGHSVVDGDYIEVTSGWSRLNGKVVRAGAVSSNDVPLSGINTTSTSLYPAGSGTGSVREITGWTQLAQILSSASEGGAQQYATYQLLEADYETRLPTVKSAAGLTFEVADDPSLAGYQLAVAADEDGQPRAIRVTLKNGGILLYNATIAVNKTPTLDQNQPMKVTVTLSLVNPDPVRYTP